MKLLIIQILIVSLLIISCGDYSNRIYIDEVKKAVISCNGSIIRDLKIDGPDINMRYEGADTIYFDKLNSAYRITKFGEVVKDYVIKLKPNSTYEIWSYSSNGDQGPYRLFLKTNAKSDIIPNKENDCH